MFCIANFILNDYKTLTCQDLSNRGPTSKRVAKPCVRIKTCFTHQSICNDIFLHFIVGLHPLSTKMGAGGCTRSGCFATQIIFSNQ